MAARRSSGAFGAPERRPRSKHWGYQMFSALTAAATALIVFWLTAFVGEDYRRWRDAKALAAALAGEVESMKFAMELADKTARGLLELLNKGGTFPMRAMPEPPATVYGANLQRLGLLGSSIGRDLPFAYHMIYAYRVAITGVLSTDDIVQRKSGLAVALPLIANANDVLPPLLVKLEARARQRWRPFRS